MTKNPIMMLLEPLEKLITEHGSAVIQEKHIALLREQLAILDKKLTMLESENKVLKAENEALKPQNQTLTVEIDKLRQKIQEYEQPHDTLLDPIQVKILEHLFVHDRLTTEQIAKALNIQPQEAKFHLEELLNRKPPFVHIAASMGKQSWYLLQEGRRYARQNPQTS